MKHKKPDNQTSLQNKKRIWVAAVLVAAIVLVASVTVGVLYAVWKNTGTALDITDTPSDTWNTSLKTQVFALLDANGEPILKGSSLQDAHSVAFVGCAQMLETELIVAEKVTLKESPDTAEASLNVTKMFPLPEGGGDNCLYRDGKPYTYTQNIGLKNNVNIVKLTIPKTVVMIASGMFSSMRSLTTLKIEGTDEIEIGARAFSNCSVLTILSMPRPLSSGSDYAEIFANTPLVSNP